MNQLLKTTAVLAMTVTTPLYADTDVSPLYKDANQPVEKRVDDLLSRMTLEEKIAQLHTIWAVRQELEDDAGAFVDDKAAEILGQGIGHIARPSENKAPITPNKTPKQTVEFVNAAQRWIIENTRLGIPAIFHEEALHGHAARDATSFPQAIALASTWDPSLLREIYTVAAQEVRRRGGTQALTPILDVARDPRWGRIEETMGEDPYLVAALGVEGVKGFQGDGPGIAPDRVIATLKHLAGHGEPTGGLNIAPANVGERTLREVFLFPFEAAIKLGGARSVMASYNEIDGVPSHANKKMLTDILRTEWGFDGTLVSDYFAIAELISRHSLVETKAEAAAVALDAGVDIEMPDIDAFTFLKASVENGSIDITLIDRAVKRALKEKFILGLFESPYSDPKGVEDFIGNETHRQLALKAAEKSITLLKNDDKVLPLDSQNLKRIAVIGPHADEVLLGGYSDVPKKTVSILEGISQYVGDDVKVTYDKGTLITVDSHTPGEDSLAANTFSKERWNNDDVILPSKEEKKGLMKKAIKSAKKADVAIVIVGDNEATSREAWADGHLGDRTSLTLFGDQEKLVKDIIKTGTPTVVILINGRPLAISSLAEKASTILEGWYLGQETGNAIANVLFGKVNPSGKLPVSIPRSVGHIPAYYNHKPSAKRGYAFSETTALFSFGHGLSYTQFEYSDIKLDKNTIKAGESVNITATIKNIGKVKGEEVVQLYINDPVASLTRPVKELKGFSRIALAAGESKKITFTLFANQLGFYDQNMDYILEPGKISVMLGSASDDIRETAEFSIDGKTTNIGSTKAFLSQSHIH